MNILARDNQTHANPETVVLTLSSDPSYQVSSPSSATMTIVSNGVSGGGTGGAGNIVVQATSTVGGGMKFTWNSVAGKTYRVASKGDMTSSWTDLSADIIATGSTTTWTDTVKSHANRQFYTVYSKN